MNNILYRIKQITSRQLCLFLIILQSCGIAYFSGRGFLISFIIFVVNLKYIAYINKKDFLTLIFICFFIILFSIGKSFKIFSYEISIIIPAYLLLVNYRINNTNCSFDQDFFYVVKFYVYNAFIGYLFYLLAWPLFMPVRWSYGYYSFLGIFNVSDNSMITSFIPRNTGLLWEPGLLQLFLNLYLFFIIIRNEISVKKIIFVGFLIFSTNSTTGYIIFIFLLAYYFFFVKKYSIKYLIIAITVGVLLIPYVLDNIEDKFHGSKSTSGSARIRDWTVGFELIMKKPFLGHGYFDIDYILENSTVAQLEEVLFSEEYVEINDPMEGGFSCGLLGPFVIYGIPIALLLFVFFYNNIFILSKKDRFVFCFVFILTFTSEPITDTSFFNLLLLSNLVYGIKAREKNFDFNNCSYI